MRAADLPPREFLVECFDYDPETGAFVWRERPEHHFASPAQAKTWNAQNAGGQAFAGADKDGYLRCEVKQGPRRWRLRAHRVALLIGRGEAPALVDHRDGNPANNRLRNLRPACPNGNAANRGGVAGKALPKCVFQGKSGFEARVTRDGEKRYLGTFRTPEEAQAVAQKYMRAFDGEFFRA